MPPPELAAAIIAQARKDQEDGGPGLPMLSPSLSGRQGAATPSAVSAQTISTQPVSGGPSNAPTAMMEAPQPIIPKAPAVEIGSFQEFVAALPDTQIKLKSDLERYVRLVSFKRGAISINITDPRQNTSFASCLFPSAAQICQRTLYSG